jgi:hypothetical protein
MGKKVNYKTIALLMCLVPSVILGSDNNEKQTKELEETITHLRKEIQDLVIDEDSLRSAVQHNYNILSGTWCVIGNVIGTWVSLIKSDQNMKDIWVLTSSVCIGGLLGVLLGVPAEYVARKYLFKKITRRKKEAQVKKSDSEIIA